MKNSRDRLDMLAFLLVSLGLVAAGFGLCALFTGTPWLGASILCTAAAMYWIGWEIQRAPYEEDEP